MATPHLGCDSTEGEHQVRSRCKSPMYAALTFPTSTTTPLQVPLVKWLSKSRSIASLLDRVTVPVTGLMFGLSGQQLFMTEPEASQARKTAKPQPGAKPPLLLRLAFDVPGEGYFFSALRAFHSRTCYGNVGRDHLVGWANSTLRFTAELPQLNLHDRAAVPTAKGVILEDPPNPSAEPRGAAAQGSSSCRDLPALLAGDELPLECQADVPLCSPTAGAGEGAGEGALASATGVGGPGAGAATGQDTHVCQVCVPEVRLRPVGM